jgi:hypothetical protein
LCRFSGFLKLEIEVFYKLDKKLTVHFFGQSEAKELDGIPMKVG